MTEKAKSFGRRSFAALSIRNYRLYYIGQGISQCGSWMQMVAITWLVLKLTHSGTMLGIVSGVQFLPILLLGPYGGLLADRLNKYRLLFVTQGLAMMQAVILAVLVATGVIHIWMLIVLAFCLGSVNAIDVPLRQTFVLEMVGRKTLTNAVSLNSTLISLARVIGPVIAGVLIAGVGLKWCFIVNAASYIAVISCLYLMNAKELQVGEPVRQAKGQLMQGFHYVRRTPILINVLLMMALVGTFAYEFPVSLPLLATTTFHGGAASYSLLLASMSFGSLIGGVLVAGRGNRKPGHIVTAALTFGTSMLLLSIAPNEIIAIILLMFVGFFSIDFNTTGNSTLQLNSSPEMRGRVMSLWAVAFVGTTPIGGPIIGAIGEHINPRVGLAVGGAAGVAASLLATNAARKMKRHQAGLTENTQISA